MKDVNLVTFNPDMQYVAMVAKGTQFKVVSVEALDLHTNFLVTFEGGARYKYNTYGVNQFNPKMNIVCLTAVAPKPVYVPTWKQILTHLFIRKVL